MSDEALDAAPAAPPVDSTPYPNSWAEMLGEPGKTDADFLALAPTWLPEDSPADKKYREDYYEEKPADAPVAPATEDTDESLAAAMAALQAKIDARKPAATAEVPPIVDETPVTPIGDTESPPVAPVAPDAPTAAVEAPAPPAAPAAPSGPDAYNVSIDPDDYDQVLSSPEAMAQLLSLHGQHVAAAAKREILSELPSMVQKSSIENMRNAAALFHLELQFPDVAESVLLVALAESAKANPTARTGLMIKATIDALTAATPTAQSIAKSHNARDTRGQFRSNTPSGRSDRAGGAEPRLTPTEQAFADMRLLTK